MFPVSFRENDGGFFWSTFVDTQRDFFQTKSPKNFVRFMASIHGVYAKSRYYSFFGSFIQMLTMRGLNLNSLKLIMAPEKIGYPKTKRFVF